MLSIRKNKNWDMLPTMDSFLKEFFGNDFFTNEISNTKNYEKINISENEDSYSISLALPGYSKEDIKIEINNEIISIYSEIENKNEEENNSYVIKEFHKSSFKRNFNLPDDVNKDNIEASMENGILSVILNKNKVIENKTNIKRIDIM